MPTDFTPRPEHHFTFGLWTVGNIGRDPFGDPVRPPISPTQIVRRLASLGAFGVNLHDNDLVPRDASAADRDRIVREFKAALADTGNSSRSTARFERTFWCRSRMDRSTFSRASRSTRCSVQCRRRR